VAASTESPSATVVFTLEGPVSYPDIAVLCWRLALALTGADVRAVTCDVSGLGHPDATTIDTLARLRLTARRKGCTLSLQHASGQLVDMLRWAGLSDAVPVCTPSAFEPGRQTELGEQTCFHEVVEPGNQPC
jgi:ABC-type transporter Mla MlaB component